MSHLEIRKDHRRGVRRFEMDGQPITIGRHSSNRIMLHDVVVSREQRTVAAEHLAHHALDAVSFDCASHFLRHGDSKSRVVQCVRLDDDEKVGGVDASPAELYSSEFVSLLDPIGARKPLRSTVRSPR